MSEPSSPSLPASKDLSGEDASSEFKPLVAVIAPTAQSFFSKREVLSNRATERDCFLRRMIKGIWFATARHVIGLGAWTINDKHRAMLSLSSGVWVGSGSGCAAHKIWIWCWGGYRDNSGNGELRSQLRLPKKANRFFVIGHPEGLKYTLSTGIISRMENSTLQISAPVSPGNSGGPVYDQQGKFAGSSELYAGQELPAKLRRNLNFAVTATGVLEGKWLGIREGWAGALGSVLEGADGAAE